ncbi:amino acid ABC transporter permease [Tsukamurella asaccharolytica]|uniref:Amino acid ABC transporter permease n=1 Tax=Tsukamurella asaccharolytica TaxID=2592067 RepID=A0A5C5RBN5_9ACTN|nr:amino acid ABC transporter permease [Tsukamurella asaccharolytica]TWS20176.1 amino acid ABC transporter permease [Tsukamurella asaccharolytica]
MTIPDQVRVTAPKINPKQKGSVLFDARGPRQQMRDKIVAVVFIAAVIAFLVWVTMAMSDAGQLDWSKWKMVTESYFWTTYILPGLWGTLLAAVVSIVFAMVLGMVLGIGRQSDHAAVRWIAGTVVEIFRSIPVLILILFAYYAFAAAALFPSSQLAFAAVVFGLTMYNGSVIAEIIRSGINSLPRGQGEAASALGLRKSQTMRIILLPQAITAMLPALISQMVVALKDSALGYIIGYTEIVRQGIQAGISYRSLFVALIVVAVIMILINYGLSMLARWVERKLRERRGH